MIGEFGKTKIMCLFMVHLLQLSFAYLHLNNVQCILYNIAKSMMRTIHNYTVGLFENIATERDDCARKRRETDLKPVESRWC